MQVHLVKFDYRKLCSRTRYIGYSGGLWLLSTKSLSQYFCETICQPIGFKSIWRDFYCRLKDYTLELFKPIQPCFVQKMSGFQIFSTSKSKVYCLVNNVIFFVWWQNYIIRWCRLIYSANNSVGWIGVGGGGIFLPSLKMLEINLLLSQAQEPEGKSNNIRLLVRCLL